ncbi:unnamed protein product, partial [Symbiodinium necroappetens]
CTRDSSHCENIATTSPQPKSANLRSTTPSAFQQKLSLSLTAAMVREKTERDYRREAARPDKRTRELLRQQHESPGAKGSASRKGSHKGVKGKRNGALQGKGKGGSSRPPSPTTPPPGFSGVGQRARPPLTLFSRRASSSEPLSPREPPYPPPVHDAGEEEEVEVEVEAEGATTSAIPQPATPSGSGEPAQTSPEEMIPETPPPLPPAATLDAQEAEPRLVVKLEPREPLDAAEDATTTAVSGNPSSGSTPHTAEHGAAVLVYPSVDGTLAELGPLYRREATAPDATDGVEDPAEWQVEVDGVRRPLPAMPEWIKDALAHRPTEAAPLTAASVRDGHEPQAGPPHGAKASDSNSSTSIAVTRVKRPRSFSPTRGSPSVNLSAGAEAEPTDKKEHKKTSKKEKKKDAKKKKKTKRSSRRKHRRRRSSTGSTSDCEDVAPTAADTEIREEASSRHTPPEGTEAAADPRPAVQLVDSALTPTSPAEGERDHSSISELA